MQALPRRAACAMPRPMPRAAPVTTATCSGSNLLVAHAHDSQQVDGRGRVVDAGDAAAGALRQADARAVDLARAGAALQLPHDLDHLRDAGGAERMALGEQAAARVDRHAAAEPRGAGAQQRHRLAVRRQAQRLVVQQLGDREGVVQLDHVDVASGRGRPARRPAVRRAR